MEMKVDGAIRDVELVEGMSLGKVLDEARVRVLGEGRVITEIKVDGEVLEAGEQEELGRRSAEEFGRVEIRTRRADELARETLRELVRHVEQVEAVMPELVGYLEEDKIQEGMTLLSSCCQVWAVVQDALSKVGILLEWDYGSVEAEGKTVSEWLGEMEVTLRGMNEALTNRDFVLLCEVLRHEFSPGMRSWQGILSHLAENV